MSVTEKQVVRARALAKRRSRSVTERDRADLAIALAARAAVAQRVAEAGGPYAAYAPMAGEPGGTHLLSELSAVAADLLLPVLQPDLDLDWARHEPDDPLYAGRPGGTLGEPVGQRLGPDAIRLATIILVPALGVDRAGFRLGRGGGSYDRALARVPAETPVIALLYADERYDALPTDSHDRRVTAVVTPAGLQSCGW